MTADEAKAITERLVRTHGPLIRKLIDDGTSPLEALRVAAKVDMAILEEIREGKTERALAVQKHILDRTWAALRGDS
jgi:hypothetical protein